MLYLETSQWPRQEQVGGSAIRGSEVREADLGRQALVAQAAGFVLLASGDQGIENWRFGEFAVPVCVMHQWLPCRDQATAAQCVVDSSQTCI